MYGYIYKTTNLINGKIYVGKHKSSYFTEDYKGSGKIIKLAIKKYGLDNFKLELVEWCEDEISLANREIYWISYYRRLLGIENCYNIDKGGIGGEFGGFSWKGRSQSLTHKTRKGESLRLSGKMRGPNHPFYGKPRSEEHRLHLSQANKGNPRLHSFKGVKNSDETRAKKSIAMMGNKNALGKKRSFDTVFHSKCYICGKEFLGTNSNSRYCNECKSALKADRDNYQIDMSNYKKIYHLTCKKCGKPYIAGSSHSRHVECLGDSNE